MDFRLRIILLLMSLLIGVAAAVGIAMRTPRPSFGLLPTPAESGTGVGSLLRNDEMGLGHPVAEKDPRRSPPGKPPVHADTIALPLSGSSDAADELPVSSRYREFLSRQVGHLEETIAQLQETSQRTARSMFHAISTLQERLDAANQPTAPPLRPENPVADAAAAGAADTLPAPPAVHRDAGDDKLTINIQNSDIRSVLEMLSQEAGLNILASRNVTGMVTANLTGVSAETALAAILKSTGFVAQREGNLIYVGTAADLEAMNQTQDRVLTKVYRPNYIRAADLQALITPMLTPQVGKVTVSSPAEIDIPSDQTKTGGNGFPGTDVVIVRDYAAVLAEVDQVFAEVDVKPRQVAIEAMILSVKLSDTYKLGVNLEALRGTNNARLVSGTPLASLADIDISEGGLKFGFLDANLSLFIEALEKIGDTNVIAAPRLTCLNKMRAEIQIGEELGYVSTTVTESAATQTVNFLDVGTLLRIRPFIDNDGMIRLEVHPELSTGSVQVQQGLSLPQKAVTQVTTQVLCPDGCTVIIGGLIREDLTNATTQIPLLGSLPWIGPAFRQTTQGVDRNEIIVLITPRIVSEPFLCEEGKKYGNQFTQRQSIYFNKLSPIGKRNLGQHHLRLARAAFSAGDYDTALGQVNLALHYDPLSRDAVALHNDIVAAGGLESESIHQYLHYGLAPWSGRHRDYSKRGYPWKEFEGIGPPEVSGTDDRGASGPVHTLVKPPPQAPSAFAPPHEPESLPQPAPSPPPVR